MSPRWGRRPQMPEERAQEELAQRTYELGHESGRQIPLPSGGLFGEEEDRAVHVLVDGHPVETGAFELPVDDSQAALATTASPLPLWRQMLNVYLANRLAVVSTILIAVIVIGCFVGPHLYPTNQTNANAILGSPENSPPSATHLLGTDSYGYDELGRIMYAGRYSLTLGFLAGLVTIVFGTIYGMVSGFFGGALDAIMMRLVDAALAIPYLFLLIALRSVFGNSTTFILLLIGFTGWFGNSRIIRGDALVIRDLEYSLAATSMGASRYHVIRRHVFPNSISNIVTVGTFSIADAILALSALGFISLGIQLPAIDWGTMMFQGTQVLIEGYWWECYPVALVFVAVIVCINYMGDALRDIFEVRLRQR